MSNGVLCPCHIGCACCRAMGHGSRVSEDCGAAIKEAAAAWLEPQILERLRISLSLCMSENGGRSLNRPTRALLSAFSAAVCIVALDKVLQIFVPLWGGLFSNIEMHSSFTCCMVLLTQTIVMIVQDFCAPKLSALAIAVSGMASSSSSGLLESLLQLLRASHAQRTHADNDDALVSVPPPRCSPHPKHAVPIRILCVASQRGHLMFVRVYASHIGSWSCHGRS